MSQTLTIQLSDEMFAALRQKAEAIGLSPAQLVLASLQQQIASSAPPRANGAALSEGQCQAARERFERHFGALDLGQPTGADNESIDADLARQLADRHEEG